MRKKGVELSVNVIIIAVIALIVLSVVIFIFYDQIRKVASGLTETREKAQICQVGFFGGQKCIKGQGDEDCKVFGPDWKSTSARCEAEDEICCEKVKPETEE